MKRDPALLRAIEAGLRHHRRGERQQAERIYREVLARDPVNAAVLNFLAVLAYQTRRAAEAERLAARALAIDERVADFHNTHGLALVELQRLGEAREAFRRALELDPLSVEAQTNLGNALLLAGQVKEARLAYERALHLQPQFADAHCGLGKALAREGRAAQARAHFERAIALEPRQADACNSLGLLLTQEGLLEEAAAALGRAIALAPDFAEAHNNLGNVRRAQGATEAAIANYRRALELAPRETQILCNLANLLDEMGRLGEAIALYRRALAIEPGSSFASRQLVAVLAAQGSPDEALAMARAGAGDGAPRLQAASVLPVIPESMDDIRRWRSRMEGELAALERDGLHLDDPLAQTAGTNFLLAYHGLDNRELHSRYARLMLRAAPALAWTAPHCVGRRRRAGRLRVGFLSRFLHEHSIGKTTRGLVAQLSRERFEVLALFVPPLKDDAISRFIRAEADRALVLPVELDAARRALAELELDVLFYQDIGMERFSYFLAFARLAPVQCVSFGHPDTTGIPAMDYFVSNDLFEPPGGEAHYSERRFLLRELGTLAYYYRPPPGAQARRREDFGVASGEHLYLCPQSLFKFHPDFDAALGEILATDPRARLVVLAGNVPRWAELLQARFARAFPDRAQRVLFLPNQSSADFTSLVAAADVMLDTPHFNGMNTSLEAFAAGTPVVTLPGAFQRARHTYGMYRRMGLDRAIARDAADYVRIAVRLASEPDRRRAFSRELAERSAVLFEDMRVVREFERFFSEAAAAQ